MRKFKNLFFDIILCILIFPYFFRYKSHCITCYLVMITILCCHIKIFRERYIHNKELHWPLWCEYISITMGFVILLDSYYTKNIMIAIYGLFIIITHFKKIHFPNNPYYF